ncbi:hypothetical protein, partial [Tumebacillus lipolyticus]
TRISLRNTRLVFKDQSFCSFASTALSRRQEIMYHISFSEVNSNFSLCENLMKDRLARIKPHRSSRSSLAATRLILSCPDISLNHTDQTNRNKMHPSLFPPALFSRSHRIAHKIGSLLKAHKKPLQQCQPQRSLGQHPLLNHFSFNYNDNHYQLQRGSTLNWR